MVISTLGVMIFYQYEISSGKVETSSKVEPSVELSLADNNETVSWGAQVRYGIQVRSPVDGNSKYGEIDPKQVFLSVSFFPNATDSSDITHQKEKTRLANQSGLTLMGQGSCFSCHADENSITGPSFTEIASSYSNGKRNKQDLINSIRKGSEGEWGSMTMPANSEYSEEEAAKMVAYIISQGSCEHCWVYLGLEGVLKIITAPKNIETGLYLLTASYTSSNEERGKDTMVLKVE